MKSTTWRLKATSARRSTCRCAFRAPRCLHFAVTRARSYTVQCDGVGVLNCLEAIRQVEHPFNISSLCDLAHALPLLTRCAVGH
jgi:hypothetical protein